MKISSANAKHADDILRILSPSITSGIILPRDKTDILKAIESFFVAELESKVVGCTAVKDYGYGLFEIRSLVVEKDHNNKGIGKKLISFAVKTVSENKNPKRIFALTLRPEVFIKTGFRLTEITDFPEKICYDCSKCSRSKCDEVAVVYNFQTQPSHSY